MQNIRISFRKITDVSKQLSRSIAVNSATVNTSNENLPLKSWQEIPGPPSLPIIGQLHHFLPGGRRIAELEIETFLAKAIENFQIEWFGPPLQTRPSSLNYVVGPFNFIFKDD